MGWTRWTGRTGENVSLASERAENGFALTGYGLAALLGRRYLLDGLDSLDGLDGRERLASGRAEDGFAQTGSGRAEDGFALTGSGRAEVNIPLSALTES